MSNAAKAWSAAVVVARDRWRLAAEIDQDRLRYCTGRPFKNARDFQFYLGKRVLLWTRKPGLGDMAMNAMCCDILRNQHGLDVWYGHRNNPGDRQFPELLKDVPCYAYNPDLRKYPLRNDVAPRGYCGGIDHCGERHPFDFIIDFRYQIGTEHNALFQCLSEFGVPQLAVPCRGLRVTNRLPRTDRYDVVLCASSGGWKPVRAYRRADELLHELRRRELSVCDLSRTNIQRELGARQLLALVKRARVYVGVETGPRHLVSGVHRRAVVIQSGIHLSAFWNVYARTHVVEAAWPCGGRLCRVRKHQECTIADGVCMDRFAPADIADFVAEVARS